jgi:hypothetical protein
MSRQRIHCLLAVVLVSTLGVSVRATPPNPVVSSIFVPLEGDIIEPGTTNTLHLTGEVHVLTQVTYSETGVASVSIWANLVRVRGTSASGVTYLAVGAGNVGWVGTSPGPPNVSEQQLEFALVNVGISPGPPNVPPSPVVPVFFRNFVVGAENTNLNKLQSVDASFEG